MRSTKQKGFTIVELLIVIVVIAILAAISFVAFNGIQSRATNTVLQSDLKSAGKSLAYDNITNGEYPDSVADISKSSNTEYQYTKASGSYCLTATAKKGTDSAYFMMNGGSITEGLCDGHSRGIMVTGGEASTVTVNGDLYRLHVFTASGDFSVTDAGKGDDLEYFIVGGGGAGGGSSNTIRGGGGGGAGGVVEGTIAPQAGVLPVVVGQGGTGVYRDAGENGTQSSFMGVIAYGGGGGGRGGNANQAGLTGGNGGSGGGGGGTSGSGGAGSQGNAGGTAYSRPAGGGGGAGGVGQSPPGSSTSRDGGAGGVGLQSDVTGTLVYYAGGGGGEAASGGLGGGASGSSPTGGSGVPGTGGGGGGTFGLNTTGGNGGSGIVIIRYRI